MSKKFFYGASLFFWFVLQSCHQTASNYIGGSKTRSNKPSSQGDGKRPSEEGEGLIGYLRSPDAIKTSTDGVQRQIFGDPGTILTTKGSTKDLDVCVFEYGDNLETIISLPQEQFRLASTKASQDGSFRLSLPESVALAARQIGLDVSGRCLNKDFRPRAGTKNSFVVSSSESGWVFEQPPFLRNALTPQREDVVESDPAGFSSENSPKGPSQGPLGITNGGEYICDFKDDPRCPMLFYIGLDAWKRSDLSTYPLKQSQKFHAVLYSALKCPDTEVFNQASLAPGAPTALSTYPCVQPLGASFDFVDSTYVSFVSGKYLLTVEGDDRWSATFLEIGSKTNLTFVEIVPVPSKAPNTPSPQ